MATTTLTPIMHHLSSLGPSLQTPKPTQPHNDPCYHHLLEKYVYPQPSRYSSPSSTNTSPSTLCSSGSGSNTLVLDEEMMEMKKAFELGPSEPLSSVASSSKGYSLVTHGHGGSRRKVGYERWMLNPEAATYAPLFPPIHLEEEPDRDLDAKGQADEPIPLPPPARPSQRQRTAPYRHAYPRNPWSEFFDMGCRNKDRDMGYCHAWKIVRSQRWDDHSLLELVHAFVRRAVDVNVDPQERERVASFASRVREAFGIALHLLVPCPKTRLDVRFTEILRETILATFISCWHVAPEHRDAIIFTLADVPSPSYLAYVTSALHLCSFISDLYLEQILSRSDTVGCIRILLHNLSLVDHLIAIRKILRRAGSVLWKEAALAGGDDNLDREVGEFEAQMWRALHVVQDHRYLFATCSRTNGSRLGKGLVTSRVGELVKFVRDCRKFVSEGCAGDGTLLAISPER